MRSAHLPIDPPLVAVPLNAAFRVWMPHESIKRLYELRLKEELAIDPTELFSVRLQLAVLIPSTKRMFWECYCLAGLCDLSGIPSDSSARNQISLAELQDLEPNFGENSLYRNGLKYAQVQVSGDLPLSQAIHFDENIWGRTSEEFTAIRDDYRVVLHKGKRLQLGVKQASVIMLLHQALSSGKPNMIEKQVMGAAGAAGHITKLFKHDKAQLIRMVGHGHVRLNAGP
jgi:hypothetical protein